MDQEKYIFSEILQGYSHINSRFDSLYLKHFNSLDLGELEDKSNQFYLQAKSQGIPTKKEKEEYIKQEGLWTPQDELEEINLTSSLATLRLTYTKLIKQIEKKEIYKAINETENKLNILNERKKLLIGETCETYQSRKFNQFCLFYSYYTDNKLQKQKFSQEEFDNLEFEDLFNLTNIYTNNSARFNDTVFKKIAISSFFLNLFILAEDDAYKFYGKPIIQLTFHQTELFSYGKYFKPIIQEYKNKLPADILSDPDKLIEAVSTHQNTEEVFSKSKMEGENVQSSVVGMSKQEIEKLGGQVVNLGAMARKSKDGILTFEEMLKSQGV